MFRNAMPRVYELRDLIESPSAPDAYFQNFDQSICEEPSKKQAWLAWENKLQKLDLVSWHFLKTEAGPYLNKRETNGRGWEQLFSILNQAHAYNYLVDQGCASVHFIPRADAQGQKTPDLYGVCDGRRVLCEVKTIHISKDEATCRQTQQGRSISNGLNAGFLKKFHDDLHKANDQIESYDGAADVKRIAFFVINFDDAFAEYKTEYFAQLDQYLAAHPISGIDIVFYNQWTACHCAIAMEHAVVVNEGYLRIAELANLV